jgi:glutathione S-transferase
MITLYTFPEAFGLRNVSPFCLKVEMALKYLELDYQIEIESDPRKAPKGKLPFIVVDGKTIADSELIFEYLNEKTQGGLFGNLSPADKALGTAFTRLSEDHLYWMIVASRWLDDEWWPNIVKGFFSDIPALIRGFVTNMARKQVRKTYDLHGLGRHTQVEQEGFARKDLQAISDAIEGRNYIVGGQMSAYDFIVASMLSGALDHQPSSWVTKIANELPELRRYADGIQEEVGIYGKQLVKQAA